MKNFNIKETLGKIDSKTVLSVGSFVLMGLSALVSNKIHENDQKVLKEALKKEITEELLNGKN